MMLFAAVTLFAIVCVCVLLHCFVRMICFYAAHRILKGFGW